MEATRKIQLTTTLPDGTTATRTTHNDYTAVVAACFDNATEYAEAKALVDQLQGWVDAGSTTWTQAEADKRAAAAEAMPRTGVTWVAFSWHRTEALAAKKLGKVYGAVATQIVPVAQ